LIWRGEVYNVDLGLPVGREPAFRRPAVVVSVDILNNGSGGLVVVWGSPEKVDTVNLLPWRLSASARNR